MAKRRERKSKVPAPVENAAILKRLAEAEKLATLGRIASKVAHELNNPMDGILRYVNLTMRIVDQKNLEKPKEYLIQCREGLMRMIRIVSELLEFSRSSYALSDGYSKIEQIIEGAVKTMEAQVEGNGVRILRDFCPGMGEIRAGNLFQVFCNLIKNALEAMPEGGELRISTHMTGDNTAVIEFQDTGTGLPTENTKAIFEPFFTTKEKGKGIGLGLAICLDIVRQYEGTMTAENVPSGGSVFRVYLPLARTS